ncbi:GNAT family N-acetyltransferase [Pseudomonas huanghezhanensis]|uniref:GNAT family N-acetyltransferase n=1 Tax=Pseudomonas huanghezhanensis TaxID=3002903 RepID=UPI002286B5DD|nr:GNAT family N-acetyltransferase [Pseudomonas sp. BSw22131]
MRRDITHSPARIEWPASLQSVAFTPDIAFETHQLLMLGRQYGGGRVADLRTWLNAFDTDPEFDRELVLVVRDTLGVVGVAQCWTSAFIRNLVVHPRAQGQGVGRCLLEQAFMAFHQRREGQVDLKVMESNLTARRLYERAGMQYVRRAELDSA